MVPCHFVTETNLLISVTINLVPPRLVHLLVRLISFCLVGSILMTAYFYQGVVFSLSSGCSRSGEDGSDDNESEASTTASPTKSTLTSNPSTLSTSPAKQITSRPTAAVITSVTATTTVPPTDGAVDSKDSTHRYYCKGSIDH